MNWKSIFGATKPLVADARMATEAARLKRKEPTGRKKEKPT
jgi:hypothetical protein